MTSRAGAWAPIALSISFLTVLPVPRVETTPTQLARAIALFPVVGMLLGAGLGALGMLLDRVLPTGPTTVLLLATGLMLTGALHLDGLMDTADGVFGGDSPQRRLEIMRDSRVGAFGAIAAGLAILAQYACLLELAGQARLLALTLTIGLSRWVMVAAIVLFPAAQPTGLGATFHASASVWSLGIATAIAVALAVAARPAGIVAFVIANAVLAGGGWFLTRRLGGLTGDTYGALAIISETAMLYGVLAGDG